MFKVTRYFVKIPIDKEGKTKLGSDYKIVGAELTAQEYKKLGIFQDRVRVETKVINENQLEKLKAQEPFVDISENKKEGENHQEDDDSIDNELKNLRKKYKELYNSDLSRRYKNDSDWIKQKIVEFHDKND
jgi:hypothetical protein